MKRKTMLIFSLCTAMLLTLTGCGGDNSSPNNSSSVSTTSPNKSAKSSTTDLDIQKTFEISGFGTFNLFKVETTERIESVFGNNFYSNHNTGEVFIDMIIDFIYEGDTALDVNEVATLSATNSSGVNYTNSKCYLDSGDSVDVYASVIPLSASRLHCAVSVPTNETDFTLTLDINGDLFTIDYTMQDIISSSQKISVSEVIEIDDFATLKFNGISYADELLPINTSGFYSYITCDNPDNTYLVVEYDLTNLQTVGKKLETFAAIKAKYMDKYNYTGYVTEAESDGTGFSSHKNIDPLNTSSCYYLIEVPKTVIANPVELTITFGKNEYSFVG